MAKPRPQKTLADYMVIAVSPALIMLLVGSLVYFLLAIGYRGQFVDRLHWILGWFVLAIVLVARIAIEQGPEQARVYGLALAGATSLVMFRFVDAPWIAIGLLAVIWWCANKLTWDSTLVDDSEDASGEGLLQHVGLDETAVATQPALQQGAAPADGDDGNEPEDDAAEESPRSKKRGHAPGLWVVYFSLLALPLFGFGQLLIPESDTEARRTAFQYLFVYVAAAMALLLTTSFLGLRRYLRQRRIQMPGSIATIWLSLGTAIIGVILVLCILLPRPEAAYSATAWLDRIAEREQEASRQAQLGGEGAQGEGRPIGEGERDDDQAQQQGQQEQPGGEGERGDGQGEPKDEQQKPGEEQQQSGGPGSKSPDDKSSEQAAGQSDDAQKDGGQSEQQGKSGAASDQQGKEQAQSDQQGKQPGQLEQQADDGGQVQQDGDKQQPSDESKPDNRENAGQEQAETPHPPEQEQSPSTPSLSNMTGWLATLVKWLIYAGLALAVLWYVIRHRAELADSLRRLWQQLLALFGWRQTGTTGSSDDVLAAEEGQSARTFASFRDPFATGSADRMKPETLVVYTFEALQAWGREHGIERDADQTPLEFANSLARRFPEIAAPVAHAGQLYAQVAYASVSPSRSQAGELQSLWRALTRRAPATVS